MQPSIENEISERLLGPEEDHTLPSITIGDHDPFQPTNTATTAGDFSVDPSAAGPLRAEAQQPEYRDAPFAIAFVLHILVVVFLAFGWGVPSLRQDDEEVTGDDKQMNIEEDSVSLAGILWLCFFTSLASIAISAFSLQVMTHHAETLIQSSLISSCCFMGFLVVAFFMDGLVGLGVLWLIMLLLTGVYAYTVWSRIPAAAANLRTALSAIETNAGVCVLGYGIAFVANLWVVVWCLAFVGVSFKESSCVNGVCHGNMNAISIILLILSYHWTSQVIKNILHVTVSGVVGTWWFAPQDCLSVWSPAIMDSFSRATTYSFGSICMGSLLVAVIQTLETMARNARRRDGNGLLLCIGKDIVAW
jgi:Plasma-membrane choline transporter